MFLVSLTIQEYRRYHSLRPPGDTRDTRDPPTDLLQASTSASANYVSTILHCCHHFYQLFSSILPLYSLFKSLMVT
jgi:hypothetical protein